MSGYRQIYEGLLPRLKTCDYSDISQRVGVARTETGVAVRFLARDYHIDADGVRPSDGQPVHVNNKSVLAYYILSPGSGEPAGIFSLPGSGFGAQEGIGWMTKPLADALQGDYGAFCGAVELLEGRHVGRSGSCGQVWELLLLPKIPCQIAYYEADEEFPVEIKILPDIHAERFLEFEQLAFALGCLAQALTDIIITGSVPS